MQNTFQRALRLVREVMADSGISGFWPIWPRLGILAIFQSVAHSARILPVCSYHGDLINTQCVCEVRARKSEASRNQEGALDRQILEAGFGDTHMRIRKLPSGREGNFE